MKLEDAIVEIKRRADIGQVIGQHMVLKKNGSSLIGLCPFHDEKTPSFNVRSDRGYFKCFGCGAAGDVFEFIQKKTGQLFMDVVRQMASQMSIEIDPLPGHELNTHKQEERERLHAALEAAHEFFRMSLTNYRGENSPLAYVVSERKLTPDRIARLGIGYGGEDLANFLSKRKVSIEDAMAVGLLREGTYGPYAFFSHRIIIPIRDTRGKLVGFGGRAFEASSNSNAKYINSPSSPLYDKSRILYGLFESLALIKKAKPLVLVEGYFDALALHDIEIGAVAPCGTSLTESHIEILGRYTRHVVLCMDQDKAGRQAQDKALLMLLRAGFQVRAARMQEKDPDVLWRQGRKDELQKIIEKAPDAVEEKITRLASLNFSGVAERIQTISTLLPFLCSSPSGLVNRQYIRLTAQLFKEDESVLLREVAKIAPSGVLHVPTVKRFVQRPRPEAGFTEAEKLLLRAIWAYPHLIARGDLTFSNTLHVELRAFLLALKEKGHDLRQVPVARDSVIVKVLVECEKMRGLITEEEARDIVRDFSLQAEKTVRKERLGQNQADLCAAERQGDLDTVRRALVTQTIALRAPSL